MKIKCPMCGCENVMEVYKEWCCCAKCDNNYNWETKRWELIKDTRYYGGITQKDIKLPDYLGGKNVYIDVEIIDIMKALWNLKIDTLSCCSGHGKMQPHLVIENSKSIDIDHLKKELKRLSGDWWEISEWRRTVI